MKFGVLGSANGDARALEQGARLLLFELGADEVIYLGPDGHAIDELVLKWAREWVGEDPSDDGLWRRAARLCPTATPEAIDGFLARERRRARLKVLKCLGPALRTVEMLEGRVAIFIHDKALLDEEDILPASLLVFGKSRKPLVRQVGSRAFVSPGELVAGRGGAALFFDDAEQRLALSFYELGGAVVGTHVLPPPPEARVQVQEQSVRAGDPR